MTGRAEFFTLAVWHGLARLPGKTGTKPGAFRPEPDPATRESEKSCTVPSVTCNAYNVKILRLHLYKQPELKGALTDAIQKQSGGMSEAEAIERAQKGDGEAFEALYSLHKRRVYSLCLRMTGNPTDAEDLAQEAFLQLFRKIATFRGESAFSTWLHRMTVNVVLMQLRKKSLPVVSLEETTDGEEDSPKRDIGAEDLRLAGAIDRVELNRAVEDLPPGYRSVFVLHDVEGFEHNEIANMVGCSIGNSKSQLHKARMKLRDILKHQRAGRAEKKNA